MLDVYIKIMYTIYIIKVAQPREIKGRVRTMNKTIAEKKAELLIWLQGCGYDNAERELAGMVKYHTTGADAVSYDYAIACIWYDVFGK